MITFDEMFPRHQGTVLQDGHIDHITGPRCIVQMAEGPYLGKYIIAHTTDVLICGTSVLVDERTGRTRALPLTESKPHD